MTTEEKLEWARNELKGVEFVLRVSGKNAEYYETLKRKKEILKAEVRHLMERKRIEDQGYEYVEEEGMKNGKF